MSDYLKEDILRNLSNEALEVIAQGKLVELHPMIFAAVFACDNPDVTLHLQGKGELDSGGGEEK